MGGRGNGATAFTPFHDYHSTAPEVPGFATGWADLILGGPGGSEVQVTAGDAVLPAEIGHSQKAASPDLLVVGAYPTGQQFDICRDAPTEPMMAAITGLDLPAEDGPVRGLIKGN